MGDTGARTAFRRTMVTMHWNEEQDSEVKAFLKDWNEKRDSEVKAFLKEASCDPKEVIEFLYGPYGGSSADRPILTVAWAWAIHGREGDGDAFWSVVANHWSTFDRIPHDEFEVLFAEYALSWKPTPELLNLPKKLTVYRGQSQNDLPGLSWTLDRNVAEIFARGHRNIAVPNSIVLEKVISREDIALVLLDEREEAEIVLWSRRDNDPAPNSKVP